ncbi:SMP-30/gluconolactonase/LRE family protein [Albimonas sp. CAU 1670]|uniref:ABC transporter permease n=1 Tax=Albimonas sp. CAU 1670 TaxID=3032599 RepID=UPI0023DA72EA|nr:SMP-30/gluconolactonase/LRE family protein [Albimonas sp. CAU 1670]MDF2231799.1 SMP-30/gluconolactonase/LRE family protein [Albimonas sp. CAU 1670]
MSTQTAAGPAPAAPKRPGALARLRHRFSFKLWLSELLSKTWMEPAIPFALLLAMVLWFMATVPNYASWSNAQSLLSQFPEFAFVCMAMGLVIISGGIDLSVGAIFAMADLTALVLFKLAGLPIGLVFLGTVAVGAALGAVNGILVGYVKTRPFLTTLVSLIVLRAAYNIISQDYAFDLALAMVESPTWTFMGDGRVLGIPTNALALIAALIVGHIYLARSRPGIQLTAVGAGRKAARHAGIRVERTLFSAYVLSGALCGIGGFFFAARQESADATTGLAWEMQALTAAVIGGISLAGGKGTFWRALIGAGIVFLLINGLVRQGVVGDVTLVLLGAILLAAVAIDAKWAKHRGKFVARIYVNPTYVAYDPPPALARDCGTAYAENDGLSGAQAIGEGKVEGPEDVIIARDGSLFCGTREGWIHRFWGENFEHHEIHARIGGRPLGFAQDRDENLIVCVGGMGVYGIRPNREVFKVTDTTNRTWSKLNDDRRLRLADDLDIAPDGSIYFSEATIRYEMTSWDLDGLEGRGNGRLIRHDPKTGVTRTILKNLPFPNGICMAHDGRSFLFASSWLCKIYRYWIEGPRAGTHEVFIDNLPGNPDNINRSSDGGYWIAMVGIRTPTIDLAMADPDFRRRMIREIPRDEWLFPGLNNGCVVKYDDAGNAVQSLWDPGGRSHSTITSMREHKGWLYLGGLENNRIGRVKLDGADPTWTGWDSYWGDRAGVAAGMREAAE